jgi:hypothetical protein
MSCARDGDQITRGELTRPTSIAILSRLRFPNKNARPEWVSGSLMENIFRIQRHQEATPNIDLPVKIKANNWE